MDASEHLFAMKSLATLVLLGFGLVQLTAAPQRFDFKDPKGVNTVIFKTDAPLESINGTATGVSGTIEFDPEQPAKTKGRLVVEAKSLHVGNPVMKEHLHGDKWLNVSQHPEIIFETLEVAPTGPSKTANTVEAQVKGRLTLHGQSKEITVPVKFTYLKDKLEARLPNAKGDLLVIRSQFKIRRSDFGINAGQFEEKVSDEIELSFSLAGQSPR